ncbi:hypothetical protein EJB05_21154 [Eragrostis curvula]|uniref:SKP1-like protein n=1 Tax=Eragrostis curvula TaxID=38414 RepID=A0A5J9V2L3_9POAL|nr:hypothetical protein EJB05_21154 [Eragrostis curvula]
MASTSSQKMVRLTSSDGESFEVREEAIGAASVMIKGVLDEGCATDDGIPLPNVTGPILGRVLEYVNKHFDEPDPFKKDGDDSVASPPTNISDTSPLKHFDREFINVGDDSVLFDLILAANYLNIQSLLDLACQAVVEEIKGKTPEEMRTRFNIVNDYPKEEEEEVRRENAWAFE